MTNTFTSIPIRRAAGVLRSDPNGRPGPILSTKAEACAERRYSWRAKPRI